MTGPVKKFGAKRQSIPDNPSSAAQDRKRRQTGSGPGQPASIKERNTTRRTLSMRR